MDNTSTEAPVPTEKTGVSKDDSQTAEEYIDEQLALEADAKEILPYKFDKCTYDLGPMRQSLFACLTCSPPPASPAQVWTPSGVCYACSISCHGEHNLVELFTRRNFVCDCGTTRVASTAPCVLRIDPDTNKKGVSSQEAAKSNTYNHNFQNKFCGCGQEYNVETEKGTMFQCLGLGTVETGGCGEDWWHPHCLMGLPHNWPEQQKQQTGTSETGEKGISHSISEQTGEAADEDPVPEGFPLDEDFASLICYKCVESNPWIKPYAGTKEFLPPLYQQTPTVADIASQPVGPTTLKRRASEVDTESEPPNPTKRPKEDSSTTATKLNTTEETSVAESDPVHKHKTLGPPLDGIYSLLVKKDFREQLCHCPECFPHLIPYPQLQEEEDEYEPSLSDSERSLINGGSGARSHGTGSLLDRGEAALSTMDRVKAIEGVMVYNHLKDKVKEFLKPYAESGKAVGAEDIKAYFEKLRGDESAIKEAGQRPATNSDKDNSDK